MKYGYCFRQCLQYKLTTDFTYSLVLNSNDRLSGTHNNPTFNVEWDSFLPPNIAEFKVCYTFQSTSGFYSDGFYQKDPLTPTAGVVEKNATASNPCSSNFCQFNDANSLTVGHMMYGVGIPIGATIRSVVTYYSNPYTMGIANLSSPTTATLYNPSPLQIVNPTYVNAVGFSSARILANFGNKSYSYDTSIKGQSINLGVISRDTQTLTSRSNTYSTFYCQSCPRPIKRPTTSVFTVSVMNNSVFQGGITAYNADNSVASYSTTASANNFLCDTVNMATGGRIAGGLLTDMTPWTMVMEFIPIDRKIKS